LYEEGETAIYYITLENENYAMPEMPAGCEEGIIRGMYRVSSANADGPHRVQLFGSGAILREALRAQQILAEKYRIGSDVWSVTSYTQLRRDAQECERWNMLNPIEPPRVPYISQMLAGAEGPCIASSDYMRLLAEQVSPWVPGGLFALGTDGMGRSESRGALRRHFEVDAECITLAALYQLKKQGKCDGQCVANAVKELGIDPEKRSALYA
jgi:pyruvate dehydrogenase E1 component